MCTFMRDMQRHATMSVSRLTTSIEIDSDRDTIAISDPALSKQSTQLEEAGYVSIGKEMVGRRTRTWLALTGPGNAAFRSHLDALRRIVELSVESASTVDASKPAG